MNSLRITLSLLLCMLLVTGCDQSGGTESLTEKKSVAFVTNGVASFWTIAKKGALKGAEEAGVNVQVRMPQDTADQKRILQELLAQSIDGIAVSPKDPANQMDILNECAKNTKLITQDSDAPNSNRLAYIGMSNYEAGRMCGKLVKKAIPDGGEIMIFIGHLGQLNADQRRQGLIDEVLDRPADPKRPLDPADKVVKNDKYTFLGTRTDDLDTSRMKSNAQESLVKYENLACMVGLFADNPPAIVDALKDAKKEGKIKVVGFDEADGTLQGIKDGHVTGTIVQNPYEYGRQSVLMLAKLAAGDNSVLPEGGVKLIPARTIEAGNVDKFWAELKELTKD